MKEKAKFEGIIIALQYMMTMERCSNEEAKTYSIKIQLVNDRSISWACGTKQERDDLYFKLQEQLKKNEFLIV